MAIKIVVTGPESSGKTSLCLSLSDCYKSTMIPDKSREYLAKTNGFYCLQDVVNIAKLQSDVNFSRVSQTNIIFCDTDALTCLIWAQEKYQILPVEIVNLLQTNKPDFYLLCFPDLDWEFDVLRENKNDRLRLFNTYYSKIVQSGIPYSMVTGKGVQRMMNARFLIHQRFPELINFAT